MKTSLEVILERVQESKPHAEARIQKVYRDFGAGMTHSNIVVKTEFGGMQLLYPREIELAHEYYCMNKTEQLEELIQILIGRVN